MTAVVRAFAAMIRVSLRDWIVTGELGPFTHGSTKAALLRRVGHPTDSGCPDLGQDAVWRYGDIELLFLVSQDAPAVLFSVSIHSFNHVPDGGRDVRIDPWIVRMSMPPGKLRGGLASLGVPPRTRRPRRSAAPGPRRPPRAAPAARASAPSSSRSSRTPAR